MDRLKKLKVEIGKMLPSVDGVLALRYHRNFTAPHLFTKDENSDDCLLYTSPSPRDVEESRMPSSA